jgi:UDP-glucose 4-epimerase
LALGHVKAIESIMNNSGVNIYNLGTGNGYSVLDLVKTFQRVNSIEVPYVIAQRRPGDIAECYADAAKAWRELGWKATHTLEDMCRDSWNYGKNK